MKKFTTPPRPSQRRPRPTARDIAIGHDNAKDVKRGKTTLHLRPVRASDHVKRYTPDQTLNVRAFIGGPTWCQIRVTTADRVPLNQALTLANARLAGHRTTDDLAAAYERSNGTGRADRLVWVLTFQLAAADTPRLLSSVVGSPGSYKVGPDNRWQFVERPEDRETDRGYTTGPDALPGEPEALSEDDWKRHVDATRDLEHGQWVALGRLASIGEKARAHTVRGRGMRKAA